MSSRSHIQCVWFRLLRKSLLYQKKSWRDIRLVGSLNLLVVLLGSELVAHTPLLNQATFDIVLLSKANTKTNELPVLVDIAFGCAISCFANC